MPFGKYLEARDMLQRSDVPAENEEARGVDLLAQLSKDQALTLRALSERTGLSIDDLRARLEPLVAAGLVEYTEVGGEDAVRPTSTGAAAL